MAEPGSPPPAPLLAQLSGDLARWLPTRRWFAGKGHRISAVHISAASTLPGPVEVWHLVVGVQLDGDHWQTYQVPVALHDGPRPGMVSIGRLPDGREAHDAVADPTAVASLLAVRQSPPLVDPDRTHGGQAAAGSPAPRLQAVTDPDAFAALPARALAVEQSNSSVALGEVALVKVFRQLVPGINPDVEVHAALGVARCPHVGRCLGWINGAWREPADGHWATGHLGMVQELLSPAVDGWALALARAASGESLAAEAHQLGHATGAVHRDLRRVLPTRTVAGAELAALVDRLHWRLDRAVAQVGELTELAPALHARIEVVGQQRGPFVVQRVHGDYHLGQVLLAGDGWKLLDFEGEPGAPIAARVVPDHPLRDVAGMLRSFAYAAAQGGRRRPPDEMAGWQAACAQAFLAGYAESGAAPGDDRATLTAYMVDKAAYEAAYESRNRPEWLPIPMAALRQLAQEATL